MEQESKDFNLEERILEPTYPMHLGIIGTPEIYAQRVELDTVAGPYFLWLVAQLSKLNQRIQIQFNLTPDRRSLYAQSLFVRTFEGIEIYSWKLDNFDRESLEDVCEKIGIPVPEVLTEAVARELIKKSIKSNVVYIKAYKFLDVV
ncbi:hypothetical protein [Paracidovorax oryzae]|uniref:hypothetical protein n=1 Tax=Paracidovorax oryzae TaxID=862720 RepID=UPI0012FF416E|nr:hypothetical protein [Paracidovorax oryzae]